MLLKKEEEKCFFKVREHEYVLKKRTVIQELYSNELELCFMGNRYVQVRLTGIEFELSVQ